MIDSKTPLEMTARSLYENPSSKVLLGSRYERLMVKCETHHEGGVGQHTNENRKRDEISGRHSPRCDLAKSNDDDHAEPSRRQQTDQRRHRSERTNEAELSIPHGSITVDGVSMTINAMPEPDVVQIAVIPYTREQTTLGRLVPGARVHVEGDVLGKFVRQLLHKES